MQTNMKQKISSKNTEIVTPEVCLEKIKKLIDAQLDFNKNLANSLLFGSEQDVCEIIISMFADLSKIPKLEKKPESKIIAGIKKGLINNILGDIKLFNQLQKYASGTYDLEHLFLKINSNYQCSFSELYKHSNDTIKNIFCCFYTGSNLKNILKKINTNMNTKNCAIFSDINVLSEMLTLLTPHASDYCIKFTNEVEVISKKGYTYVVEKPVNWMRNLQLSSLPDNSPYYPELHALIREYLSIDSTLIQQQESTDCSDDYVLLYEKKKLQYSLIAKIEEILKEAQFFHLNARKQNEEKPILKKPAKPLLAKLPVPPEKELLKISALMVSNNENMSPIFDSIQPVLRENEITTISEQKNVDFSLSDPLIFNSETDEVKKEKEAFCDNPAIDHYRLFSKASKKEPETVKTQSNILNLNKDHEDTLKKTFNLIDYDYIKLRALVNLAVALGATIKTTGANRCRIEMKNIYAHLLINETDITQSLENKTKCDKATVTMHGGGHRSTRSQNNDSDKAPQYLVDQFRAAFTRAGYTPENLLINLGQPLREPSLNL